MFKLQPNPTFKVDVTIQTTDGAGVIEFEFRHKGRKALKAFFDSLGSGETARPDAEALLDLVSGWGKIDTAFSPEALAQLLDDYPTSAKSIFEAYNAGLFEGKTKNS